MKVEYIDNDTKEVLTRRNFGISATHALLIATVGNYKENKLRLPESDKWVRIVEVNLDYAPPNSELGKLTLFVEPVE